MKWEQQEVIRLLKGAPGTQYQEATDANRHIMRDWVRSLLDKQPITVTFIKADGTDRTMRYKTRYTAADEQIPVIAWIGGLLLLAIIFGYIPLLWVLLT